MRPHHPGIILTLIFFCAPFLISMAAAHPESPDEENKPERIGVASDEDMTRLNELRKTPGARCIRAQFVTQCLSGETRHLYRLDCGAGGTEGSCCRDARRHLKSGICGPVWDRLKTAGKTYSPGKWLCECTVNDRTPEEPMPIDVFNELHGR